MKHERRNLPLQSPFALSPHPWLPLLTLGLGLTHLSSALAALLQVPENFPTLQAAITAAQSGDEIRLAPGVYNEQALIRGKNLTLTGSAGTVLRASPQMTLSAAYLWYNVVEVTSADVVVQNIEFQGEHLYDDLPNHNTPFSALSFNGGGNCRVENCRISGFRGTDTVSSVTGVGVATWNPVSFGGGSLSLVVRGCTFADNAASLWLTGDWMTKPALPRTTFLIVDNAIHGIGPTTLGLQFGILIAAGAGGTIRGNRITDHFHADASPAENALGIFAYDMQGFGNSGRVQAKVQPIRIENNTFVGNQNAVGLAMADGSVVAGNTFLDSKDAVLVSGSNLEIRANRFTDAARGLVLLGQDPVFGTAFGTASDVAVTANRFCHVTTPVQIQSGAADVAQQGTLLCPFPLPMLGIDPALVIGWPDDGEAHTLESALEAGGPWAPFDAAPVLRDGRISYVIPPQLSHRFFRLQP